ncbi:DNA/RNA non-specific endonuclease [Kribbella amoyensis]|uniref:DNA/RNA non-specific endonuclease n=1 Tax=Kribbella amoyensis TaxID=996641 RepID=A0A561BLM3_9ACTN|nr:DNA/RNA non-specific endonuclease [Kribbella amoyensis]TWD79728.1 DNA/RNA non-specific endonuclease [Kribbella amoyensis]
MPSDLERVAAGLVACLNQVPQVVQYLHRLARQCRESAAFLGGFASSNPAARTAALQLDEAARRCEEAAQLAAEAPVKAGAWAQQMVRSGAERPVNDRLHRPGAADPGVVELDTAREEHKRLLDQPPADSTVRVDRKFTYRTDEQGRVVSARTTLDELDLDHPRDAGAQRRLIGKLPGDHAGHLFARIFRGPGGTMNLVPMEAIKVNLGQYKVLENRWRKIIEAGGTVEVFIELNYPEASVRPDIIDVGYRHDGRLRWVSIVNSPRQKGDSTP